MTTEMIAAAVLYSLAVLGLAWGWLRARADAADMETQLRRLMGASIDLNVVLDHYAASAKCAPEVQEANTKAVVEKVNGLRLQLQAASTFLGE